MTHRFIAPKKRSTRAEAESTHARALHELIEVAKRQGAVEALEMAHALTLANGDLSARGIGWLLEAVRKTLET